MADAIAVGSAFALPGVASMGFAMARCRTAHLYGASGLYRRFLHEMLWCVVRRMR